jgi:hypothetical protein
MDQSYTVNCGKAVPRGDERCDHVLGTSPSVTQPSIEGLAGEVLHDDEPATSPAAAFEHLDDVGMLEASQRPPFGEKS